MGSHRDNLVVGSVAAVVGGLVVLAVQGISEEDKATPILKYVKTVPCCGAVQVVFESGSSRPFLIHGYFYRIVQITREPPDKAQHEPQPLPAAPPELFARISVQRFILDGPQRH